MVIGGYLVTLERISAQDEVYDFLLSQPTAQAILRFQPSVETLEHLRELLQANRSGTLTPIQKAELDEHIHAGHFVRMLKIRTKCPAWIRSEEHTSELQSQSNLVCRLLLEK